MSSTSKNKSLDQFIHEVSAIEKKDSIYTNKQQIERLLRPGSSYANLNPFDVLLLENFEAPIDEVKKQYKKLSILLHPDKNPDDRERAQTAFEVINRAYKTLQDEKTRADALEVVEEARHRTRQAVEEKRKRLRREGRRDVTLEEDDPAKFQQAVKVLTMKLFADYERKRRSALERMQEEKKRKREEELTEEKDKREKDEWNKNYEESREVRISSWKSFQTTKKTKKQREFRPPQHKAETR